MYSLAVNFTNTNVTINFEDDANNPIDITAGNFTQYQKMYYLCDVYHDKTRNDTTIIDTTSESTRYKGNSISLSATDSINDNSLKWSYDTYKSRFEDAQIIRIKKSILDDFRKGVQLIANPIPLPADYIINVTKGVSYSSILNMLKGLNFGNFYPVIPLTLIPPIKEIFDVCTTEKIYDTNSLYRSLKVAIYDASSKIPESLTHPGFYIDSASSINRITNTPNICVLNTEKIDINKFEDNLIIYTNTDYSFLMLGDILLLKYIKKNCGTLSIDLQIDNIDTFPWYNALDKQVDNVKVNNIFFFSNEASPKNKTKKLMKYSIFTLNFFWQMVLTYIHMYLKLLSKIAVGDADQYATSILFLRHWVFTHVDIDNVTYKSSSPFKMSTTGGVIFSGMFKKDVTVIYPNSWFITHHHEYTPPQLINALNGTHFDPTVPPSITIWTEQLTAFLVTQNACLEIINNAGKSGVASSRKGTDSTPFTSYVNKVCTELDKGVLNDTCSRLIGEILKYSGDMSHKMSSLILDKIFKDVDKNFLSYVTTGDRLLVGSLIMDNISCAFDVTVELKNLLSINTATMVPPFDTSIAAGGIGPEELIGFYIKPAPHVNNIFIPILMKINSLTKKLIYNSELTAKIEELKTRDKSNVYARAASNAWDTHVNKIPNNFQKNIIEQLKTNDIIQSIINAYNQSKISQYNETVSYYNDMREKIKYLYKFIYNIQNSVSKMESLVKIKFNDYEKLNTTISGRSTGIGTPKQQTDLKQITDTLDLYHNKLISKQNALQKSINDMSKLLTIIFGPPPPPAAYPAQVFPTVFNAVNPHFFFPIPDFISPETETHYADRFITTFMPNVLPMPVTTPLNNLPATANPVPGIGIFKNYHLINDINYIWKINTLKPLLYTYKYKYDLDFIHKKLKLNEKLNEDYIFDLIDNAIIISEKIRNDAQTADTATPGIPALITALAAATAKVVEINAKKNNLKINYILYNDKTITHTENISALKRTQDAKKYYETVDAVKAAFLTDKINKLQDDITSFQTAFNESIDASVGSDPNVTDYNFIATQEKNAVIAAIIGDPIKNAAAVLALTPMPDAFDAYIKILLDLEYFALYICKTVVVAMNKATIEVNDIVYYKTQISDSFTTNFGTIDVNDRNNIILSLIAGICFKGTINDNYNINYNNIFNLINDTNMIIKYLILKTINFYCLSYKCLFRNDTLTTISGIDIRKILLNNFIYSDLFVAYTDLFSIASSDEQITFLQKYIIQLNDIMNIVKNPSNMDNDKLILIDNYQLYINELIKHFKINKTIIDIPYYLQRVYFTISGTPPPIAFPAIPPPPMALNTPITLYIIDVSPEPFEDNNIDNIIKQFIIKKNINIIDPFFYTKSIREYDMFLKKDMLDPIYYNYFTIAITFVNPIIIPDFSLLTFKFDHLNHYTQIDGMKFQMYTNDFLNNINTIEQISNENEFIKHLYMYNLDDTDTDINHNFNLKFEGKNIYGNDVNDHVNWRKIFIFDKSDVSLPGDSNTPINTILTPLNAGLTYNGNNFDNYTYTMAYPPYIIPPFNTNYTFMFSSHQELVTRDTFDYLCYEIRRVNKHPPLIVYTQFPKKFGDYKANTFYPVFKSLKGNEYTINFNDYCIGVQVNPQFAFWLNVFETIKNKLNEFKNFMVNLNKNGLQLLSKEYLNCDYVIRFMAFAFSLIGGNIPFNVLRRIYSVCDIGDFNIITDIYVVGLFTDNTLIYTPIKKILNIIDPIILANITDDATLITGMYCIENVEMLNNYNEIKVIIKEFIEILSFIL